ncbi:TonB-dependent receptor family protein [Pseudoxanthomonas composti]|uniref:TonB-dependent receptor n=1 Tax=Pseudoxanthomonas composti TaxID=2137479 RepID=A0A4Q1JV56_9GAMM|nr:TonB-dependent receptor [Pseudoxanthomonas composti]RXR06029.1 TonB-dependent receptor [Pseudoxanthomonas composti]
MRLSPLALGLTLATASASAQEAAFSAMDAVTLDKVQVQATRVRGVAPFDLPASLTVVGTTANRPGVQLSEMTQTIPGLVARDRQNYAQDTQLSLRGFGARSTFGVRGVRLYTDGIPASMPDGQGQASHFNLLGGDRIEVLRGPFSALYGNSSGGVVQLWSQDGTDTPQLRAEGSAGPDHAWTAGARVLGRQGTVGYNLSVSRFETDGVRAHSAARRDSANLKLDIDLGTGGRLDLVGNFLDMPQAQDPLGLSWAQVQDDPTQATPQAAAFNTRKSVRQSQAGAVWTQDLTDAQQLRVMAYGGQREVIQFLAIPAATQANPLHAGGVIDLDSGYGGADARWSWKGQIAGKPLDITVGGNLDRQRQHRTGYDNFVGSTLGVRGNLRRDERNAVENLDGFAQAYWKFAPRWSLLAGLRYSTVEFTSRDRYIVGRNPDDSGRARYHDTTPVAGLVFAPNDTLRLHVSAGRGFETPTFNELGYRADGGAGLAFELQPAISQNLELGMKWRAQAGHTLEAALFRADTDDELAVATNSGGRSTYRNVGQARRQGAEVASHLALAQDWTLDAAYTWIDASFRSDFLACSGTPCSVPSTPIRAGTRIPGIPAQQLFTRLQWQPGAWSTAVEAIGMSSVTVNDQGSERAPGYGLINLELAHTWRLGEGTLRAWTRLENALDRRYIGSVIVNDGNGRYYEPGPDRGLWVGVRFTR